MSPSKYTISTWITPLKLYLQDAATTVSWSDVSWKEGMVGVAVVDISPSWTVNLPFTNPPELFGLSAGALILQIRKGIRLCRSSSSCAQSRTGWQSTCALQSGDLKLSPLGQTRHTAFKSPWRRTDALPEARVTSLWLGAGQQHWFCLWIDWHWLEAPAAHGHTDSLLRLIGIFKLDPSLYAEDTRPRTRKTAASVLLNKYYSRLLLLLPPLFN